MKKEAKNVEPDWHSGPPPCVGWWPASAQRDLRMARWWNGNVWSRPVQLNRDGASAAIEARVCTLISQHVEWRDRPLSWPIHARLDTSGGHWTYNTTGLEPSTTGEGRVEVVLRSGRQLTDYTNFFRWRITGLDGDVIAWREVK